MISRPCRSIIRVGTCVLVGAIFSCADGDVSSDTQIQTNEQALLGTLTGQRTGKSGSRLTAQYIVHRGGVRHFWQFWDNTLDTPCNYAQAPSGELFCFPENTASMYYSDPECTQPVYSVFFSTEASAQAFTPPPAVSVNVPESTCGPFNSDTGFEALEVGDEIISDEPVYEIFLGQCFDVFPFFPFQRNFEVTPLNTDRLVRGRTGFRFAGGWRLLERVVRGRDGSRSPMNQSTGNFRRTYYDRRLRADVEPAVTSQGVGFDKNVAWATGNAFQSPFFFTDDTCTTPAAIPAGCSGATEVVAFPTGINENTCRLDFEVRQTAGPAGSTVFSDFGGCTERTTSQELLSLGATIDRNRYVRGRTTRRFRFSKLQSIVYRNNDNSEVPIGFYDAQRRAECRLSFVDQDEYACLPIGTPGIFQLFADDACTVPILARNSIPPEVPEAEACYDGPLVAYSYDRENDVATKFVAGAPLTDQTGTLYIGSSARCNQVFFGVGERFSATSSQFVPEKFHVRDF